MPSGQVSEKIHAIHGKPDNLYQRQVYVRFYKNQTSFLHLYGNRSILSV
jgi:hypothetical protein